MSAQALQRQLDRVNLAIEDTEREYRLRGAEISRLQLLQASAITSGFVLRAEKRRFELALAQPESVPS